MTHDDLRVVLASHNAHKIAEFRDIAVSVHPDLDVVAYDGPEPVEDGVTFAQNALIKARAAATYTGLVALADDSGLCVDAMGGAPGVFSAYWAGHKKNSAANNALLLDQLSDISDPHRSAYFSCTIALVTPDGVENVVEGRWPGKVASATFGGGGFGYDPLFIPESPRHGEQEQGVTVAQWTPEEKNEHSHRARAFRALLPLLSEVIAANSI